MSGVDLTTKRKCIAAIREWNGKIYCTYVSRTEREGLTEAAFGALGHFLVVQFYILSVEFGCTGIIGASGVGVREKAAQRGEHRGHRIHGAPFIAQEVHAHRAALADVGVEHLGGEADARRPSGIIVLEVDTQRIYAALPRRIRWPNNGCAPHEQVALVARPRAAPLGRITRHRTRLLAETKTRARLAARGRRVTFHINKEKGAGRRGDVERRLEMYRGWKYK